MKKYLTLLLLAFTMFAMPGCGSESSAGTDTENEGGDDADSGTESTNGAISIWEGHSLYSEVGPNGKWLATLTFGEKMELLGEKETDPKNQKEMEKVKLLDGKEGWVRADMIHAGGTLAVTTAESQVYSRPGISNIKDEVLAPGTLIVQAAESEEFIEFYGRNSGKSRPKGWILGNKDVSTDANDVSLAIMLQKAMDEKVPEKRRSKLESIASNSTYANSPLMPLVKGHLDGIAAASELREDQLMITGDDVNVRSAPSVGDNKLFKLGSGEVCDILEKGSQETIGDKTDFWYRINAKGQTGWVFGSFTSKAL